jgi:hypothetical protein
MQFMESKLLGIQIDETGREAVLSFIDAGGVKFTMNLHGVEKIVINEFRQQNVIENMKHWRRTNELSEMRAAAFTLITGAVEKNCSPQLAMVVQDVENRIMSGELELMEITAIFGAQIIALFTSMTYSKDKASK